MNTKTTKKYKELQEELNIKVGEYNKYYSFNKLDDENICDMIERLQHIEKTDIQIQNMASEELTRMSKAGEL